MINHVLVPLDTSLLAESALPYAQYIVDPSGLITLLTIYEEIDQVNWAEGYIPSTRSLESMDENHISVREETQEYLKSIAAKIQASSPTVKLNILVETGDPGSVILDKVETEHVDAIVMTTQGRSGLSRMLFGSVTQKVIYSSICPVFVIPGKALEPKAELSEEDKLELLKQQQAAPSATFGTFKG